MIKMSCPYCEAVHDVKEIRTEEKITFKEKLVSYTAIQYECCNCHETFETAEMMDANLLAIEKHTKSSMNLLNLKKLLLFEKSITQARRHLV